MLEGISDRYRVERILSITRIVWVILTPRTSLVLQTHSNRPILFIATLLYLFFMMQGVSDTESFAKPGDFHFEYTTITGYFLQSENDTDDSKFNFVRLPLKHK